MIVENIMTPNPVTISPIASAHEARTIMGFRGIRHLLVCEFGRLLGIISDKDIPQFIKPQLLVADIMTTSVISIPASASVESARSLMRLHSVASLPVLNGTTVVGIVTVADLMGRSLW